MTNTIILCGGPINYSNLPIGTNLSNAMIPINGKPVIAWILDDLMRKQIDSVIVVLRAEDERLHDFLQRAYRGRLDITLVPLAHEGTILQSLQAGLKHCTGEGQVRIILGDTMIRDSFAQDDDMVYVGTVEETRRWCIAFTDAQGRIVDLVDKQEHIDIDPRLALAGYYHLQHAAVFARCVDAAVASDERNLSRALLRYNQQYPIQTRHTQQWFDFGNIDNLVDARRRLLQSRHFNTLTINPVLNTITKVSKRSDILQDELDWYLTIPEELKVLTPRIISHHLHEDQMQIVQEYYGYPTLAELFVYGDLPVDSWVSILRHVMRIHAEFRRYRGVLQPEAHWQMYAAKTWSRLDALRSHSTYWQTLLEQPSIEHNDTHLLNIPALRPRIEAYIARLVDSAPIAIVHGDYCFSNILFDVNNQIIRLIDPRGSFGQKGIYGDPRYDVAKLRHSVHGLYDYITADMFEVYEQDGCFGSTVYASPLAAQICGTFDSMIEAAGYRLDEIRFIEGLLFISMPPLHSDNFRRQQMMFLTGLTLLNEVIAS